MNNSNNHDENSQSNNKEDNIEITDNNDKTDKSDNEEIINLKDYGKNLLDLHNNSRIFHHKVKQLPLLNSCTYDKGYITQNLSICLTCNEDSKNSKKAGLCPGCSLNCHDEYHDIKEIGYKRHFRCDCGNSNFHQTCDYQQEKDYLNIENKYNHNFDNKYCYCDSAEGNTPMIQCMICEDWYHFKHIKVANGDPTLKVSLTEDEILEKLEEEAVDGELICNSCLVGSMSFLKNYPIKGFVVKTTYVNNSEIEKTENGIDGAEEKKLNEELVENKEVIETKELKEKEGNLEVSRKEEENNGKDQENKDKTEKELQVERKCNLEVAVEKIEENKEKIENQEETKKSAKKTKAIPKRKRELFFEGANDLVENKKCDEEKEKNENNLNNNINNINKINNTNNTTSTNNINNSTTTTDSTTKKRKIISREDYLNNNDMSYEDYLKTCNGTNNDKINLKHLADKQQETNCKLKNYQSDLLTDYDDYKDFDIMIDAEQFIEMICKCNKCIEDYKQKEIEFIAKPDFLKDWLDRRFLEDNLSNISKEMEDENKNKEIIAELDKGRNYLKEEEELNMTPEQRVLLASHAKFFIEEFENYVSKRAIEVIGPEDINKFMKEFDKKVKKNK